MFVSFRTTLLCIFAFTVGCGQGFESTTIPALQNGTLDSSSGQLPLPAPLPSPQPLPNPSPSPSPTPVAGNLVSNPSFESEMAGWEDWGNSSIVTTDVYSGARSLKVVGQGGRGQEVIYRLKTGATYLLRAYAKVKSDTSVVHFGIRFFDAGNVTMGDERIRVRGATYTQVSIQFTMPVQVSSAKVYLFSESDMTEAYIDDVVLTQISAPVAPPTLPAIPGSGQIQPRPTTLSGYKLVFNEDFLNPTLDTKTWNTGFWFSYNLRSELQAYRPENIKLGEGFLSLLGEKRNTTTMWGEPASYASGAVNTRGKFTFTFGVVEARLRVPRGRGYAPAFWLLPNMKRSPPEMNIMEIFGHETNTCRFNYKWVDGNGIAMTQPEVARTADYAADYHTYTLEWLPDRLNYYIDGALLNSVTSEFILRDPAFIILNLAIGGTAAGNPDATTAFPQGLVVDYVRVWQK